VRACAPTRSRRAPRRVLWRAQGEFGAGERVEAVYAWLTENCLADPGAGFALARPDRAPLPPQQTLRAAGLLPSCLLNFSGGAPGQPVLRRDLLAGARPA